MKRQIEVPVQVCLPNWDEWTKPEDIAAIASGETKKVGALSIFNRPHDAKPLEGFTLLGVGTAVVFLDDDPSTYIESKADAIRAEITKVRADAQNAITRLTEQLNNLLALEHNAS